MGTARAVQDLLPSRHDPLAVRYADRTVENRIVGVQRQHVKYDGHRARGVSRDEFLNNFETLRADDKTPPRERQINDSGLLHFCFSRSKSIPLNQNGGYREFLARK